MFHLCRKIDRTFSNVSVFVEIVTGNGFMSKAPGVTKASRRFPLSSFVTPKEIVTEMGR